MISVDEAKSALRHKAQQHQTWLEWVLGRGAWPHRVSLRPPAGQEFADNIVSVLNTAGQWKLAAESGELPGTLTYVTRRAPGFSGSHELPKTWIIDSAEDAMASFPDLLEHYDHAASRLHEAIAHPSTTWTGPSDIPLQAARLICGLNDPDWSTTLAVTDHLARNTVANMMVRQVAIPGVSTKWMEEHASILAALLCPPRQPRVGATALDQLHHQLQLRAKQAMLNVALRCPQLRAATAGLERFAATVSALNNSGLRPSIVLICENLELLDTLTLDRGGLAIIHGLGRAVTLLAELQWLHTADTVLYWGDIDRVGLQCLDTLRRNDIETTSLLMDLDTLQRFEQFSHGTKTQVSDYAIPERLTASEALLYEHLITYHQAHGHDLQLEQEHIPTVAAESAISARMDGVLP